MNASPGGAGDRTRADAGRPDPGPGGGTPDPSFGIEVPDAASFSLETTSRIRHNYHLHPLMQLPRLEALAESLLPLGQCRFIDPGITESTPFVLARKPRGRRTIEDVFRGIEEPGAWIALYNVETDPVYRRFLWDAMESAGRLVARKQHVFEVRGFIFISAPPSVTPFHIDRENNFWLQVHGRKTLHLWDRGDREVVSGRDVEDFILFRTLDNVRLADEHGSRRAVFDCGPGDGVYFPSTTPHSTRSEAHWVKPGAGVAVSIGIVFYTDVTRRSAYVHAANHLLRRLGVNPRGPGQSSWLDRVKYPLGRLGVTLMRRRRERWPPPGF
jgi:hypothetical protein